jgi:hypothetical protein
MLGLCFYFLPKVWARGEKVGKDFTFAAGEEQRAVYEMYRRAGLRAVQSQGITIPPKHSVTPPAHPTQERPAAERGSVPPATPTRQRAPLAAPAAERAASAAAALRSAERQAGVTPSGVGISGSHAHEQPPSAELASEKQLGLVATLIASLYNDPEVASAINALGAPLGIHDLSTLRSKAALHRNAARLTRLQASKLIDRLKALQAPAHRAA